MFVGHYAAAFAAKAIEPKTPLWTLVAGCQLIDIGWSVFVATGVEHVSVDPSLPGSTLVLYDMPWTHSLPAAAAWSVGAFVVVKLLLRSNWAATMVALSVFSHWILDFLVHRPDLALWPGGEKVGLGWWNYPVPEAALEVGLVAICGGAWIASRKGEGRAAWPAIALIALLIVLQIALMFYPTPEHDPVGIGVSALAVYLMVTALAGLSDRPVRPRSA